MTTVVLLYLAAALLVALFVGRGARIGDQRRRTHVTSDERWPS